MLKGYFYRRASEDEPSEFEINIRFEVNSKESILAKTSSLNSEGLYFFLPRSKVILVPDERVLLMLELPERGQFKIQTEVNYFCNITDPDGNPIVCYGIKFMDISHTVWQMIHDFCGIKEDLEDAAFAHIPTSLASIFTPIAPATPVKHAVEPAPNAKKTAIPAGEAPKAIKEPAISRITSEKTGVTAKPPVPFDVIPAVSVKPLVTPEDITAATAKHSVVPEDITAATAKHSVVPEDITAATAKHSVVPEDITAATAKHSVVPEDITAATAKHSVVLEDITTATAKHSVVPEDITAATAKHSVVPEDITTATAKHSVVPEDITTATAKHSVVPEDITTATAKPVITPEDIPVAPVKPAIDPKDIFNVAPQSKSAPVQNSIQALAASLATPPIAPSHPKAQSLSQEAIDRLIQKLQAEEAAKHDVQTELPPPSAVPDTPSNQNLDNLWITENELNSINSDSAPKENLAADNPRLIQHDPFTTFKTAGSHEELHFHESDAKNNPVAPRVDIPSPVVQEHPVPASIVPDASPIAEPAVAKSVVRDITVPAPSARPISETKTGLKISFDELKAISSHNSGPETAALPVNTAPVKKETGPMIPPIMPSNSGAKMDQKSIDKLVQALLQESEANAGSSPKANTATAPFAAATHEPKKTEPKVDPLLQTLASGGIHQSPAKPPVDLKPAEPKITPVPPSFGGNLNPATAGSPPSPNVGLNILIPDPGNTRVMDQKSIDKIVHALTQNGTPAHSVPNIQSMPSKNPVSTDSKRTLDQKAIDQVVQALTQSPSTGSIPAPAPQLSSGNEKRGAYSLASLSATLQLDKGEILNGAIEQVYVGGLMVRIEKELPLNCSLKITILGESIRIIDIHGACTNCEPAGFGKNGYLAEIFFKNLSNAHMEQFRSLISRLDID
jgi:hypothetical protein